MDPVTTLASIPAIVALVNLAKGLGLPSKAAAPVAIVIGIAINTANHYLAGNGAYQSAVTGLLMGLAAAGLYDVAKASSTQLRLANNNDK